VKAGDYPEHYREPLAFIFYGCNDLFRVLTGVLNKEPVSVHAAAYYTCQVDSANIRFMGILIYIGTAYGIIG
jgi:hypothetical protein